MYRALAFSGGLAGVSGRSDAPRRRLGGHGSRGCGDGGAGFTLIETLVVAAIVALLVALALPGLGRARESALRVRSQANMRTIHQWTQIYADTFDGQVAIGYRGGRLQWNTMVYSGTSGLFVLHGHLVAADLVETGEALYSPAERAEDQSFDTPSNPWPPGTPGVNVQGGYALAPLADWGFAEFPSAMPRIDRLGSRAILADGFGLPERVDSRHRVGVHALHADAAVRWVEREAIDEQLSQCVGLVPANNPFQQEIWDLLDRR